MSKIINVGRVTAYADAVKGGYQGTREEWESDLANLGTTAAEVEADRQEVAANTAAVATDKGIVEGYKDAANLSAQASAASAGAAHTDALAATAAKEASETAQGLAESAKDSAVAAKGGAETAHGAAEAAVTQASGYADNASGSATAAAGSATAAAAAATAAAGSADEAEAVLESIPEDYSTLSNDVTDLKSAVAKIDEDMDVIFPENDPTVEYTLILGSYVKEDGTIASYNTWTRTDYVPCSEGEQYQVHWHKSSNYNCYYDSNKSFISSFYIAGHPDNHTLYETITVPSGASYFILSNVTNQMTDFDLKKVVPESYDYNDLVDEVENIRIGADGTVYNSAGEAVRTQIEQLSENISDHDGSDYGLSTDALLYESRYPSYWNVSETTPTSFAEAQGYLDNKIAQIPQKGKSFIYITDTHWDGNQKHSTDLINYIRKRTGIKTVLFGGDVIGNATDKYAAVKKMASYLNQSKRAFGYDYIPCVGDHDYNTVSVADDADHFVPYSQTETLFVSDLERRNAYHFYDASEKLAQFATAGSDDYNEAMAFFHTVYYVDDNEQRVRYIVLNTGCGGNFGAMYNIFGTAGSTLLRLQADWLADTLKNTPSNYDVIVLSHKGNTSYSGTNATVINAIMYGAKVNGIVYPHPSSAQLANVDSWWPNTTQYDFSNGNKIGRILAINGHHHGDVLRYFGRLNAETSYATTTVIQSGSTIIQPDSDGSLPNSCQIPIIVTSCDSLGVTESYSPSMTAGTITEQCFDVITLTDDAVVMTRIGAGDDRILYISKTAS